MLAQDGVATSGCRYSVVGHPVFTLPVCLMMFYFRLVAFCFTSGWNLLPFFGLNADPLLPGVEFAATVNQEFTV